MTNSVDPDQTALKGAVCSGSTLFASILHSSVMLGNYLQQTTSADNFFRCIFFLSEPSADTLENSFEPRSGPTNHRAWSWSKLFDFIFERTFLKKMGMFWENHQTPKKHENYPDRYWRKIQRLEDFSSHKFLQVLLDNTCCCSKVHWPLEKGIPCQYQPVSWLMNIQTHQSENFYFQVKFINCYLRLSVLLKKWH